MTGPPIPQTLDEALDPAWLSAALGVDVIGVSAGEVDARVSTNVPVELELDDGSTRVVWIKGYFSDIGRKYRYAGIPEAGFYADLVESVDVRTLHPAYAAADADTGANVILTDDVIGDGATFLDARSPYSPDQAAASLDQLARLHTRTWLDPVCGDLPWLGSRLSLYTVGRGVDEIRQNFEGPIGAGVPVAARDVQRLYDAYVVVARDADEATPWSVVHGDSHIGNVYLDSQGRPCFADWQLVQRGPWYLDVGYHLASCLSVEDRRAHERDLVAHYLDRLRAGGVDAPPDAEVWPGFARGILHGFYLWGITSKVDPMITATLLERLGTAADDHESFREVGC